MLSYACYKEPFYKAPFNTPAMGYSQGNSSPPTCINTLSNHHVADHTQPNGRTNRYNYHSEVQVRSNTTYSEQITTAPNTNHLSPQCRYDGANCNPATRRPFDPGSPSTSDTYHLDLPRKRIRIGNCRMPRPGTTVPTNLRTLEVGMPYMGLQGHRLELTSIVRDRYRQTKGQAGVCLETSA